MHLELTDPTALLDGCCSHTTVVLFEAIVPASDTVLGPGDPHSFQPSGLCRSVEPRTGATHARQLPYAHDYSLWLSCLMSSPPPDVGFDVHTEGQCERARAGKASAARFQNILLFLDSAVHSRLTRL